MDPLTITLAVITLATAFKDIIETAQLIQDSFSKLPQNYRNAQRLSQQLLDFLHGMEEVYREHEEILNKKESFKNAIFRLQKEMEYAQNECARLIPPVATRNSKTGRFKFSFYSFWNRKKVEGLLSELKDHVFGCTQHFQLINGIRTGAHVVEMHETLVRYTTHGSPGVHGQNSLTSTPYGSIRNISNTQLLTFTQSMPMPMTTVANIPAHDLANAYLRREVGRVDLSLRSILTRWSQNFPVHVEVLTATVSWNLEQPPVSRMVAHQNAVVQAIRFQSHLQSSSSESWLDDVDCAIQNLANELDELDMFEDAIALGNLRVDLWRVVMRQNPSRLSSLGLVRALRHLARFYSNIGDQDQAYPKREEAVEVLQSLTLEKGDTMQMVRLMLSQALASNRSLQLQLVIDARKMLADTLGTTNLQTMTDLSAPSNWVAISKNNNISDDDWYIYARSLLHIAQIHGSSSESHKLAKLILAILNHLLDKYPDSQRIQGQLSKVLAYLSGFRMDIAQNLKYIEQNVTILRRLAPSNPQRYVLSLARALWSQREALVALRKSREAEDIYQDLLNLKDLAAAPLHSDLRIPSETEGDYYIQLAEYHYNVGRFPDAIYTAQNAVSQYSALEFMNPDRSRAKHILALAILCDCLVAGRQSDAALLEGSKVIEMVDHLGIDTTGLDQVILHSYGEILCMMMGILEGSSRPGAIAQAKDISARIRKFAESRKIKPDEKMRTAMVHYSLLLEKNGMRAEAMSFLRDILNNWRKIFGHLSKTAVLVHLAVLESLDDGIDIDSDYDYMSSETSSDSDS